jgi:hypothetical protein
MKKIFIIAYALFISTHNQASQEHWTLQKKSTRAFSVGVPNEECYPQYNRQGKPTGKTITMSDTHMTIIDHSSDETKSIKFPLTDFQGKQSTTLSDGRIVRFREKDDMPYIIDPKDKNSGSCSIS